MERQEHRHRLYEESYSQSVFIIYYVEDDGRDVNVYARK